MRKHSLYDSEYSPRRRRFYRELCGRIHSPRRPLWRLTLSRRIDWADRRSYTSERIRCTVYHFWRCVYCWCVVCVSVALFRMIWNRCKFRTPVSDMHSFIRTHNKMESHCSYTLSLNAIYFAGVCHSCKSRSIQRLNRTLVGERI